MEDFTKNLLFYFSTFYATRARYDKICEIHSPQYTQAVPFLFFSRLSLHKNPYIAMVKSLIIIVFVIIIFLFVLFYVYNIDELVFFLLKIYSMFFYQQNAFRIAETAFNTPAIAHSIAILGFLSEMYSATIAQSIATIAIMLLFLSCPRRLAGLCFVLSIYNIEDVVKKV